MKRRKSNNYIGIIVVLVVLFTILGAFFGKRLFGSADQEKYQEYVQAFSNAIIEYSDKEIPENFEGVITTYSDMSSLLIEKGYLSKFEDDKVLISGNDISLMKQNWETSFYNYYNTTTLENRFELKFTKDGKTYTCTKNECK